MTGTKRMTAGFLGMALACVFLLSCGGGTEEVAVTPPPEPGTDWDGQIYVQGKVTVEDPDAGSMYVNIEHVHHSTDHGGFQYVDDEYLYDWEAFKDGALCEWGGDPQGQTVWQVVGHPDMTITMKYNEDDQDKPNIVCELSGFPDGSRCSARREVIRGEWKVFNLCKFTQAAYDTYEVYAPGLCQQEVECSDSDYD